MTWRRFRAIRGATSAAADTPAAILEATRELLLAIVTRNALAQDEIVSVIFTVTTDLSSAYPAQAARELGWNEVPLLCMTEIPVPHGPARCIRILMHVEFPTVRERVEHVYLHAARQLRPDLVGANADPNVKTVAGPVS
jgi:chorismate mutase